MREDNSTSRALLKASHASGPVDFANVDLKGSPAAPHGRIFKRAETDKEGVSGWVPLSESVRSGIDRIRAVNPALGESPLFPAPRAREKARAPQPAAAANATNVVALPVTGAGSAARVTEVPKPWTRHYSRALLERAEGLANLGKVEGGDFHPYRRKWSTERKHLPDVDVAAAGGWSDTRALKTSYQQVDDATLLAVISEPTKLREAKPGPKADTA
jgi:hypothetical protein